MDGREQIYYIGKDWKDGKIVKYQGTYHNFEEAKDNTKRNYAIYDPEGNELYRNKSKKPLIIFLFVLAFLVVSIGATLSIYNYLNRTIPNQEQEYNYYNLSDGTEIRYSKNELIIPYADGKVVVPPGGGRITFPDGSIREVPEGTIALPDGTIIIPDKNPPTIDEFGNVITNDDDTEIVSPKCTNRVVPLGTIIRPNGMLIIPIDGAKVYVDRHNYVHVKGGKALVVLPDCTEYTVSDGSIITPGTDKDKGDDYVIVDPNGGTEPTVDDNGNIITNDDDGKVINKCGIKTVPRGTIVRPDGTIVIPDKGTKLSIDKQNNIIVSGGGATVIFPNCDSYHISDGSVITPGDNDGDTGTTGSTTGGGTSDDHNSGAIVDPDGGTKPTVDDNGNVITNDEDNKVITEKCGSRTVRKGSIIRPDGTIYIPDKGSKVYVNDKNEVVVEGKATMVLPDCTEKIVTGTVPPDDEIPVCDPAKKCCSGDTYINNKNCPKPVCDSKNQMLCR